MFSHSQDWGRSNNNTIALLTARWATQEMVHQTPLHAVSFLKGKATLHPRRTLSGQALPSVSSVESPRWPGHALHPSTATIFSVTAPFGFQSTFTHISLLGLLTILLSLGEESLRDKWFAQDCMPSKKGFWARNPGFSHDRRTRPT